MSNAATKTAFSLLFIPLFLVVMAGIGRAIDEFEDLVRIERLPQGDLEVESAFRKTRASACELVPAGEPLEIRTFTSILTTHDRRSKQLPIPSTRRGMFTVGLEFEAVDRTDLPLLSRGQIVDYVNEHYLSIQGRVRRDLLDRQLYYHHRPIAVTAKYRGSLVSQAFEPIISGTVQDFHGLGLFLADDPIILKPKHFRTLVLIFRTPLLDGDKPAPVYEFVFVRGRESDDGQELDSHVFVTTKGRKILHWLNGGARPRTSRQTTILGQIAITRFDGTGLYPEESAARGYRLSEQARLTIEELDEYCQSVGLTGSYGENLDVVLDAIIDGQLRTARTADGL